MTETTSGATRANTAKHINDPFGTLNYQMPNMEVPAQFREMTDKGVAYARDTCAKAKVASEQAADLLESAYGSVAKSATDYNLKLIDFGRTNTRAAFDYANELLGVKSPSELIALSTAHMRKQFDIASPQNKELYTLAQAVAAEAAGPIKASMSRSFNKLA
jgi:phasin